MALLISSCGSPSNSRQGEGSWQSTVQPSRVNESLYKLREPPSAPSMVILYFHGFYSSDSKDVHFSTWQSEDGSSIWPEAWLAETFPGAEILYVSYKANVGKRSEGKFDMYMIGENLVSDFLRANIGQTPNCPVVLVGYCFGGLAIKELCLDIQKRVGLTIDQSEKTRLENLLGNIKGVFYYGTPHKGSPCVDTVINAKRSPLLEYFKLLSTGASRLNFEFAKLCKINGDWRIQGLGENIATRWGPFKGVVVAPEACARDGDQFNVVEADHIAICRPSSKTDRRFYALESFLHIIANNVKVSTRSMLGDQCQGLPSYAIDLEKRAQDVIQKLQDGSVVGIFGMGGIGKTTLAKKVYNNISKDFEYTCFVENVKKKFSNDKLKDYLLDHFHQHGCRVKEIQWADLKEKQALIVMDDVDSEDQLSILPELHHFGNGSRIIMTSRDKEIFKVYENCNIHEMEFLNSDEAKKLFCQHAFKGRDDIPDSTTQLNKNVIRVVKKCGGLPLTLEIMGRYLQNHEKDASVWEETIDKLGNAEAINGGRNDRVWASLKVSYDALAKEEQEMFNEAAMYFFDEPLERALVAWSTTIKSPKTRWANLVSRSMVKEVHIVHYDNFHPISLEEVKGVWVHEQLRDLASSLAKGVRQSGFREKASKLVDLLNSNKMKEETEYLQLKRVFFDLATVNFDSLIKLQKLKYLEFEGVMLEGSGKNFPSKLCILRWTTLRLGQVGDAGNYPMFTINLDEMNHLAILELEGWDIPKEFPDSLGNLTNLRILVLSKLSGLNRLPENFGNFSRLIRLELRELEFQAFPESFGKLLALEHLTLNRLQCSQLPESLGDLSSLVTLRIHSCRNLSSLPTSFGRNLISLEDMSIRYCPLLDGLPKAFFQLSGLQRLQIQDCKRFKNLGESFGNLGALCSLILLSTSIERLPTTFGLLSQLEELSLDKPGPLKMLPENFGQLTALKKLKICSGELELSPRSFGLLTSLEELNLECHNLVRFPESFGELPRLKTLALNADFRTFPESFGKLLALEHLTLIRLQCSQLPESLGDLSSLVTLRIESFRNLSSLPTCFGRNLMSLKNMWIKDCPLIDGLPESFSQLLGLQRLEIQRCKSFKNLGESFGNLGALSSLILVSTGIERLPTNFGLLSQLEELSLDEPGPLKMLPENFDQLTALKKLKICGGELELSPRSFGLLTSLEELNLECHNLVRFPESFGELPRLKTLELNALDFRTFPESFGKLLSLKHLTLNGLQCSQLPESFGDLSSLATLRVLSCRNLSSLPTSFGRNLMSLKNMWITDCPLLNGLPESFSQLSGLQQLDIRDCESFKNLGESFGNLGALCSLILVSTSIENLPTNFGLLSELEELTLYYPGPLEMLPENFGQLTALKKLEICGGELELLPQSFGLLTSLKELRLECNNLVRFPESFGELPRLETLEVEVNFVRALPDNLGKLSKLKSLSIAASSLRNLPTSMGELFSLRDLLMNCWSLEKLPDNFGELSSLEKLVIRSALLENLPESIGQLQSLHSLGLIVERMRSLPESVGQLSSLRRFAFDCDGHERMPDCFDHLKCSSLGLWGHCTQILPEGVGSVRSLENLEFHEMSLKRLPEELGSLPSLRKLKIIGCRYLKTLPQSLGHMSLLQEINLEGCRWLQRLPYSWGRPSSSQVALPQAERRNEIMNVVEEPFSQTTATEGLRLVISGCPHLTISVLTSFGFVRETGESEQPRHDFSCEGDCGCGIHIMV